jgi:predicted MFS family arabinose efflux permease
VRRSIFTSPMFIIVCGCLISAITFGVRGTFGLFTAPLSDAHGWSREVYSFAMALQNLVWGAAMPFAGAIADKYGNARVLIAGAVLFSLGTSAMAYADSPLIMHLTGGVLVGLGVAGASFAIVMSAFVRVVPEEKRSWAFGISTAAGSLGQFLFAPLGQAFITAYGWQNALVLLGLCVLLVIVLAFPLYGKSEHKTALPTDLDLGQTLKQAFSHKSYLLLSGGFFVCGFHVAFIATHLPPYLTDAGLDASYAAWAIAIIGLANVVGSYLSGVLGGVYSKRLLLSGLYFSRAIVLMLFVLMPPTPVVVFAFAIAMGFLWLSTVPLTNGLVLVMFGTRYMTTLFGFVLFSHQIGAFLGVWLGGVIYERTGSYEIVWWIAVALGLMAALLHWPIEERPAEQQEAMAKPL